MKTIAPFIMLIFMAVLLAQCTNAESQPQDGPTVQNPTQLPHTEADDIKRGEYLVQTMGCHDCHSPKMMTPQGPVPDPKLLLSGHPASEKLPPIGDKSALQGYVLFTMGTTSATGPWGTSFAANLTPDETGIGNWTLEQFGKALREGKSKGMDNGRMLLPPMPWQNAVNLSDADLTAIWAYLRTVQPVKNVVPAPVPPMG